MTTVKNVLMVGVTALVLSSWVSPASAYYITTVAADNPNLWYRFEDATSANGTTMANSGTDGAPADGTYHGTVTLSSNTPYLIGGKSASFDGSSSASIPNGFLPLGSSARTIEGWFNNDEIGVTEDIISQGVSSLGETVAITANQTELSVGVDGQRWGITTGSSIVAPNTWHYFAFVFPSGATTSDQWQVYLDGAAVSAGQLAGLGPQTMNTQDGGQLGVDTTADSPQYVGLLDEVAVYNTALTATQIEDHFESAMSVPEPASLSLVVVGGAVLLRRRRA